MAKGLTISCDDLHNVSTDVKLFNGQDWEIRKDGKAIRFVVHFMNGKKSKRVYFQPKMTSEIFPKIKCLYDKKGRIVATRANENTRLVTTRHNQLWTFPTKEQKKIDVALRVYLMIEGLESKEYAETIQNYWNNKELQKKLEKS